jgi:soluble lytic murein transglycosylase-like protein
VFKSKIIVYLLLFSFLPPCSVTSAANLSSAVEKHKHIKISSAQLQKLRKYDHLIRYYSNFSFFRPRYKVSPDFIRALILAESNCNTFAVSPKDALGLGQIIHSTGKKAARDLSKKNINFRYINTYKLQNLQREDLFDPAINILLTCYLISKYNYRFNGRLELVVSAWNAGENVDSLKIGLPAPYSETHNLIGKVNAYYLHLLKLRKKF